MRRDVQEIFRMTPHEKQVMMFSATLSKEMRLVCKKFMQDVNILFCTHFKIIHLVFISFIVLLVDQVDCVQRIIFYELRCHIKSKLILTK